MKRITKRVTEKITEKRITKGMGFLIGAFYFIMVVLGVICLATSQFRSSSGSAFDTWRFNYDANRFLTKTHQEQLDEFRTKYTKHRNYVSFSENCLRLYDESGNLKSRVDRESIEEAKDAKKAHKSYEDMQFNNAACIFRGFEMLYFDRYYFQNYMEDDQRNIAYYEKLLTSDEAQYSDLIKGHQEFVALKECEKKWYMKLLVDIPYDLLVLCLVMSMGLLGGMIRILREYGHPEHSDPPLKDYFFVPLIGAVVAIGGYILAKTGLLLLSTTGGETSLSPFMVALVGMVSGLLAREVVDRIAAVGRKILKNLFKKKK
jgi:hypothetical protein